MQMIGQGTSATRSSALLSSFRTQAVLGLIAVVYVTAAVRFSAVTFPLTPALINSMVYSGLAYLGGLFLIRRVSAFPGTNAFGLIIPSFCTSFGVAGALIILLRQEYIISLLLSGFVLSLSLVFLINFYVQRNVTQRFYTLPSTDLGKLPLLPGIEWVVLESARLPDDPNMQIVADLRHDYPAEWERLLAEAAVAGYPVYHIKHVAESLTGRVALHHLSENNFGSLIPNLAYRKVKRVADVIAAIVLLPLLAPALALIALVIRLDSAGSPIFRQERMGFRGKVFTMYKFRTMRPREEVGDESAARHDAVTQSGDARITRVGAFLRRTRLDELPQMINILRGEMSWIGPRPEAVPLSRWYELEIPFYQYRHIVRPGITGWAQVNQGHVADLNAVNLKLNFDFYYIKNFSAAIDILIVLKTIRTMVTGFGSK